MIPQREETRKVQQLGSSTLALSLPSEWAATHGIEKGDSITIRQNSESLSVLSPSGSHHGTEAVVHADNVDAETLERIIIAQYVLGRRVIDVETDQEALSTDAIDAVYAAEERLMGLGVIEETAERISIRCSIDPEDFVLDQLVERLESTAKTMRQDAIKALAYANPDLARRAINRERQANKIFILLLRLVFNAYGNAAVQTALGLESGRALIGYRAVAKNLELSADAAADLAELAMEACETDLTLEDGTIEEIRTFTDRVDDVSATAVRAFVERDYEATVQVRSAARQFEAHKNAVLDPLSNMPVDDVLLVRDVLLAIERSGEFAVRNAEIAANVALDGESAFVTVS